MLRINLGQKKVIVFNLKSAWEKIAEKTARGGGFGWCLRDIWVQLCKGEARKGKMRKSDGQEW